MPRILQRFPNELSGSSQEKSKEDTEKELYIEMDSTKVQQKKQLEETERLQDKIIYIIFLVLVAIVLLVTLVVRYKHNKHNKI